MVFAIINRRADLVLRSLVAALLAGAMWSSCAHAEFSDGKIVIGVMGDQSGVVADVGLVYDEFEVHGTLNYFEPLPRPHC